MDTQPLPVIPYESVATTRPSRRGKGCLALCATFCLAGAGQILAGRFRRGAIIITFFFALTAAVLVTLMVPALVPALLFLAPASAIFSIAVLIDAYRIGHRATWNMLGRPWWRYLAAGGFLLLAMVANPNRILGPYMRTHFAETFVNASEGMAPTIQIRDRFIVHIHRKPQRWSIIAFRTPGNPSVVYVKRVVALPGERVEIADGKVLIDGRPVPPPPGIGPYTTPPGLPVRNNGLTLTADEYYVIGDNSARSLDSRYFTSAAPGHQLGAILTSDVQGVATWIYWPPAHWKRLDRP